MEKLTLFLLTFALFCMLEVLEVLALQLQSVTAVCIIFAALVILYAMVVADYIRIKKQNKEEKNE